MAVPELTKEQFSALVSSYERLVYTICRQMVRDPAAAEDLCQETFLAAWQHCGSCPEGFEKQWLARIATNKAKDFLQSAYERHTLLTEPDGFSSLSRAGPEPEDEVLASMEADSVRELIFSLRETYRAPCVLFFLEDKTAAETAKRLHRPEKTVRTQIRRAQMLLRAQIDGSSRQKGAQHGTV